MIEIPIVINYDMERVIGSALIDETQLPPFMDYCLTLGYILSERSINSINTSEKDVGTLTCLSVQDNSAYYKYLNKEYGDISK